MRACGVPPTRVLGGGVLALILVLALVLAAVSALIVRRSMFLWDGIVLANEGQEEVSAVRIVVEYGESHIAQFFIPKMRARERKTLWVKDMINWTYVDFIMGSKDFLYDLKYPQSHGWGEGQPSIELRIMDDGSVMSEHQGHRLRQWIVDRTAYVPPN